MLYEYILLYACIITIISYTTVTTDLLRKKVEIVFQLNLFSVQVSLSVDVFNRTDNFY